MAFRKDSLKKKREDLARELFARVQQKQELLVSELQKRESAAAATEGAFEENFTEGSDIDENQSFSEEMAAGEGSLNHLQELSQAEDAFSQINALFEEERRSARIKKLREAIVWSEILLSPKAKR